MNTHKGLEQCVVQGKYSTVMFLSNIIALIISKDQKIKDQIPAELEMEYTSPQALSRQLQSRFSTWS